MEAVLGASLAQQRFAMRLVALFAVLAAVLASIGIYGLAAQIVAQRTAEIGIRMALGASPRDVMQMIVRQGATLTATGIVVGLAAAALVSQVVAGLLFSVSPSDPVAYATVAGLVAIVGVLACLPAAWRATRIDPIQAIRQA